MPRPPAPPARLVGRGLLASALVAGLALLPLTGATSADAATVTPRAHLQPTRAFGSGSMGWRQRQAQNAPGARSASPQARSAATSRAAAKPPAGILGIDVASYQGNVDWKYYKSIGKQFTYVKATEGVSYRNPYFGSQYTGAYKAGLYHGAYHFATPNGASGAAQADYFVAHGGGWSRDGRTLPGVLDIEYNPYGSTCYGLSNQAMVTWVKSFTTEYKKRTKRDAVIYSTTDWWTRCTGNSSAFSTTNPLWIARYSSSAGTLPHKWGYYTFWQYSATGIDQDTFNGSSSRLKALSLG